MATEQSIINSTSIIFFIFIFLYASFLFINKVFSDATFDFYDIRSLTPIMVSTFIIIILFFISVINLLNTIKPNNKYAISFISLIMIIYISFYSANFVYGHHINTFANLYAGVGYSRYDWQTNKTIKEIEKFPEDTVIYTNEPVAIYILIGRAAYMVPSKKYIYSNEPNYKYKEDLNIMKKDLKSKKGILVLFKVGLGFLPKDNELKSQMQLHLLKPCSDGAIYEVY